MAMISMGSPISADLMYQFYDNKAITPQIRDALQKRQDLEDSKAKESGKDTDEAATASNAKKPNDPGPATRVSISDQLIRMNIASKTSNPEDLKSRVKVSPEVQEIEKKLAEQEAAKKAEEDKTKDASDTKTTVEEGKE